MGGSGLRTGTSNSATNQGSGCGLPWSDGRREGRNRPQSQPAFCRSSLGFRFPPRPRFPVRIHPRQHPRRAPPDRSFPGRPSQLPLPIPGQACRLGSVAGTVGGTALRECSQHGVMHLTSGSRLRCHAGMLARVRVVPEQTTESGTTESGIMRRSGHHRLRASLVCGGSGGSRDQVSGPRSLVGVVSVNVSESLVPESLDPNSLAARSADSTSRDSGSGSGPGSGAGSGS